jgi:hypothetical protein
MRGGAPAAAAAAAAAACTAACACPLLTPRVNVYTTPHAASVYPHELRTITPTNRKNN